MVFDAFAIVTIFWLGKKFAARREAGRVHPWLEKLVKNCAKVSFGMYLCQEFGLLLVRAFLNSAHFADTTLLMLIPLGVVFVIATSFEVAWFFYRVPPFGLLIGRPNAHVRRAQTVVQARN